MTEAASPLAEELDSIGKRIIWIIEKFGDRYPGLHENYTLIELLYWKEYHFKEHCPDLKDDPTVAHAINELIFMAADGELPSSTSIHRATTIVKKLFQDEKDRVRSDEKEAEYRAVLIPDRVEWKERP